MRDEKGKGSVEASKEVPRKKIKQGRIAMTLGAFILAALCVAGGFAFWMNSRAAHPQRAMTAEISGSSAGEEANPIDWNYWKSVNPDIAAWISVPGTDIDQPIVKASPDNPQFYLNHDVYGEWNFWGCPYLDSGCEAGIDSWNAVILGHNISFPPAMFHDFENYHDEDYANSHREIILYTPDDIRHLNVLAVDNISGGETIKRVKFDGASDYWWYVKERLHASKTLLDSTIIDGVEQPRFKQMYTFVTCTYYFTPANERTLIYAM